MAERPSNQARRGDARGRYASLAVLLLAARRRCAVNSRNFEAGHFKARASNPRTVARLDIQTRCNSSKLQSLGPFLQIELYTIWNNDQDQGLDKSIAIIYIWLTIHAQLLETFSPSLQFSFSSNGDLTYKGQLTKRASARAKAKVDLGTTDFKTCDQTDSQNMCLVIFNKHTEI